MPSHRHRRDRTEVSCCLKYVIFGFNIIFWFLGFSILAIGVWAWSEKNTFNNLSKLTHIPMDPAFMFIIVGAITFIIGFTGCVGALRENTCLLAFYAICLAILLLLEMTGGILCFIFKDWFKEQATEGFRAFIVHYRDDPDQQNLIDWIQEGWLHCCGVEGPKDWDGNRYFNCSAVAVGSSEACGVPFSCCIPEENEIIRNKQCGYGVRSPDYPLDYSKKIYDQGCLTAGEAWVERNLLVVASVAVSIAFLQILGICFAQNLRADIFAQKSKWGR
ncbi:tetraspanin-5-like isoform X2 [Pollicipes pollicipes]|uniref:tetraspanin-5-like isoform X1 n=1 Tax=Pollicipes pollicipes TaxID=41117 RepID=UPI00188509AC|nr:tetraspanin-5-like isoform X1 [Pollicipes pollicipes]XP_037083788.1 tetraspanin-5-like isoform X2 [Pollicipes pollicipes]